MGVEEMSTGKITPLDICYNCLWNPLEFHRIIDPGLLLDIENMKNKLLETEKELLKND
jgi:hypothetical protein